VRDGQRPRGLERRPAASDQAGIGPGEPVHDQAVPGEHYEHQQLVVEQPEVVARKHQLRHAGPGNPPDVLSGISHRRGNAMRPVGFQNSAISLDLGFYAARSYSLMRPPRSGLRWICFLERSAGGVSGRGGRSWRLR